MPTSITSNSDDGWGKWFRDSFDKFLLFTMFVGQVSLVVWMIRQKTDQNYINWAQNIVSTVLGTLLGLITGKLLSKTDASSTVQLTQSPGGGPQSLSTLPASVVVKEDTKKDNTEPLKGE